MTNESSLAMLDTPEVSRVLFHPRRDPPHRPLPLGVRAIRIQADKGIAITGRLHRATPDGPTVLFFHGNGEIASDYDEIGSLYTDLGINLLVMDYRGYGSSDGQPTVSHLLNDAITVYEKIDSVLVEHALKTRPLFIMGRSLGSAAAIEIARCAGQKINGLIIESGFAHTLPLLATLGLHIRMEYAKEGWDIIDNADKIAQVHVPTLIIHGQLDSLIPIAHGHELHERSGAATKQIVAIPHAGHNDLFLRGHLLYFEALRTFVFRQDR